MLPLEPEELVVAAARAVRVVAAHPWPRFVNRAAALVQVEEITSLQRITSQQEKSIRHTFHELKTPLAVLSLGLSNLSTYYERMPDEDRRAMIDDLADQVRELGTVVSNLFQEMREGLSKTILDE